MWRQVKGSLHWLLSRELARQFAENGFDLFVTAEDAELADAASELRGTGVQVAEFQADLADYDGVEELYEAIQSDGRPVAALTLNAGVGLGGGFANDQSLDDILRLVRLNI